MLQREAIIEFQKITKKVYGKDISFEEATAQGNKLLTLFKVIYQPVPKDWKQQLNQKYGVIPS